MKQEKILVSDFDGTMTERDFYQVALDILPAENRIIWEEYKRGKRDLFPALAAIFSKLRGYSSSMESLLHRVGLDKDIVDSCRRLQLEGWKLVIASAGCAWYIEKLLFPIGIKAEIQANPGYFSETGGLTMEYPFDSPYYSPTTGINKALVVKDALEKGLVAFAGDGGPDVEAALLVHPSRRFAKRRLAEVLAEKGEGFHPFSRWSAMVEDLLTLRQE
ncbi:MAG: HAD-IB family phosphatase [Thermodesulfobacteriota bacterium]